MNKRVSLADQPLVTMVDDCMVFTIVYRDILMEVSMSLTTGRTVLSDLFLKDLLESEIITEEQFFCLDEEYNNYEDAVDSFIDLVDDYHDAFLL